MTSLVRGQKVKVYQASVTGEHFEGVATLIKCLDDKADLEHWVVLFPGYLGEPVVSRWIDPDNVLE